MARHPRRPAPICSVDVVKADEIDKLVNFYEGNISKFVNVRKASEIKTSVDLGLFLGVKALVGEHVGEFAGASAIYPRNNGERIPVFYHEDKTPQYGVPAELGSVRANRQILGSEGERHPGALNALLFGMPLILLLVRLQRNQSLQTDIPYCDIINGNTFVIKRVLGQRSSNLDSPLRGQLMEATPELQAGFLDSVVENDPNKGSGRTYYHFEISGLPLLAETFRRAIKMGGLPDFNGGIMPIDFMPIVRELTIGEVDGQRITILDKIAAYAADLSTSGVHWHQLATNWNGVFTTKRQIKPLEVNGYSAIYNTFDKDEPWMAEVSGARVAALRIQHGASARVFGAYEALSGNGGPAEARAHHANFMSAFEGPVHPRDRSRGRPFFPQPAAA